MRIAALFCGLIAGLFALVVPVGLGTDLLTLFLHLWGPTPGQQFIGNVAWYAVPAIAVLGGLLAFLAPGVGALLLLIAGASWIGMGMLNTALFRFEILVPGLLGIVGAVLAFLAGELELRRRRMARRQRRNAQYDDEDEDGWPSEDDDREAAFNLDPLTVSREEAPPRPSREIPLTLDDMAPPQKPQPQRRSETIWPDSPGRRPAAPAREPDLTPRRSLFDRPATVVQRPAAPERPERQERQERAERPARQSSRERYFEEEPAPRRNLLPWIIAANAVVVIIIALGVGYLLMDRKPQPAGAAVVANTTDATTVAAIPAAQAPVPAAATDAKPEDGDRLVPNLWPALAEPGSVPAATPALPMAPASAPAATTVATAEAPAVAGTFNDPYAYCQAVKTIDYVDSRYTGPRFTADIAEALRVPHESAPDRVSWRCVDGVILACASFDWPVCSMTPTAQEMLDYCQRNPGVTRLLAPNGTWSCEGNRPRIPEGASWPVDARGFFPNAWIPLPPQQPTAG